MTSSFTSMTSSSSSTCITGMPPSAPGGRVTWSRSSSSRLSAVLPLPFRRRLAARCEFERRHAGAANNTALPPAQQPLLTVVPGRPCSPRHWYQDPPPLSGAGYSRTLPWRPPGGTRRGAGSTLGATRTLGQLRRRPPAPAELTTTATGNRTGWPL